MYTLECPEMSYPKACLEFRLIYHFKLNKGNRVLELLDEGWEGRLWEEDQEKYGKEGFFNKSVMQISLGVFYID